jgi:hypothetical protein
VSLTAFKTLEWQDPIERRLTRILTDAICLHPNPFFTACIWGFSEIICNPSTAIANLNALNSNGEPGRCISSKYGHYNIVKTLLEMGFDVNAKNLSGRILYGGRTALYWAASEGHKEVVQLLVEKEAIIDAKNTDTWTPLKRQLRKGTKRWRGCWWKGGPTLKPKLCTAEQR